MRDLKLVDSFDRTFNYLRLSIEDACDYRCLYCLPGGFHKEEPEPPLRVDEIRRLVNAFAEMGFWKVRLTGGEPTVRRDLLEIVAAVASTPGVRKVALSTNGARLSELADDLAHKGVDAVNVSVDSMDADRFRQITGRNDLAKVLAGVERCLGLGLEVKLNTVLLKDLNEGEFVRFVELTRERALGVRFIELMPTSDNAEFFRERHLKATSLISWLGENGWSELPRSLAAGPARRFRRLGYVGSVGVIAPYSNDFCATCNRLRVTSRGRLRLCLFAEGEHSLRPLLQSDDQRRALQESVRALLGRKDVSHYLPEGRLGDTRHFAAIGG
jgi:cyclic pyranopterin phosphate synthase